MSEERLAAHLKALVRAATLLLVLFGATIAGGFGIMLFVLAGRKDWGIVYLLSLAFMFSFDSEEEVREIRKSIGGTGDKRDVG